MPVVTEDRPTPGRRRGRLSKEFRKDAGDLVIDQKRTVADVARKLGQVVHPHVLVGNDLSAHLQILNVGVEEQPDDAVHLKADVPAQYFFGN
jgi:hypothetical protein